MARKQKSFWPFGGKQKKNDGDSDEENPLLLEDLSSAHPAQLLNYQDEEGRNLLIIAIVDNEIDRVKRLLEIGFDPNSLHNGRLVVSIAYENGNFDIVLALLENDSRFPNGFNADEITHEGLKTFVTKTREFHAKIKSWQELTDEDIEGLKQAYPNVCHFYGVDGESFNRSAVFVSMTHQKMANVNTLRRHQFVCTRDEFEILRTNPDFKETLGSGVDGLLHQNELAASDVKLPESLCSKSFIGINLSLVEQTKRYGRAWKAFDDLNKIDEMKPLLKFLVIATNVRIVFDFQKEHCESINLQVRNNSTKNIYIGAQNLLSQENHEILDIYATIAREIARYVIGEIFQNRFSEEFSHIVAECKKKRLEERLISKIFSDQNICFKELELLATVPQLIVLHSKNRDKLEEKRKKFPQLFKLYEERVLPQASMSFTRAVNDVNDAVINVDEPDAVNKRKSCLKRNFCLLVRVYLILAFVILGVSYYWLTQKAPQSKPFQEYYKQCGEIKVKNLHGKDLIVGPSTESAYPGQWPWLGALFINTTLTYEDNKEMPYHGFICGSSLITPWHLLTAAHCTEGMESEDFYALLGRYDLANDTEIHFQKRTMSALYTHPDYDYNRQVYKSEADIAVFRMAQKVVFNDYIQPICFPHPWANVIDVSGVVAGYGKHKNESLHENLPKFARLETMSASDCVFTKKGYVNIVSKKSFCASHIKGTASPCTGDSGGGFYVETGEASTRFILTGVVSQALNSKKCDPKDNVVFVNVMDFREWIIEKVSNCTDSEDCVEPCNLNPCGKGLTCKQGAENTHSCV